MKTSQKQHAVNPAPEITVWANDPNPLSDGCDTAARILIDRYTAAGIPSGLAMSAMSDMRKYVLAAKGFEKAISRLERYVRVRVIK
jgi:hypothetical protein